MAEGQDERLAEIRRRHQDGPFGECETCDVLNRLEALTAERDAARAWSARWKDCTRGLRRSAREHYESWLRACDSERQMAARLAAAEGALQPAATINGIMGDLCDMEQEDPDHNDAIIVHYDTLKHILERWVTHGGVEPPLAGSREQAAATTTTRTITMRCHCGRGVTIGPDPWCEGCVQSAATCDCVPVVIGEGA